MCKSGRKEMNKMRSIKNSWYDWLNNYIPDPIRKTVSCFKVKIVSLFKADTPKYAAYGREEKLRTKNTKTQKQYQ